jgi:hypothetical protein
MKKEKTQHHGEASEGQSHVRQIGKQPGDNLSSIKQDMSHNSAQGKGKTNVIGRRISEEWGNGLLV